MLKVTDIMPDNSLSSLPVLEDGEGLPHPTPDTSSTDLSRIPPHVSPPCPIPVVSTPAVSRLGSFHAEVWPTRYASCLA